ncbi:hypothetical protein [Anaerococcus sp. Marseille-Q7828]|uniref:hypothetical protein n=1 Tax=Anaerococcus sp. Marseille-Q7828 TaxID=3036300 RepID=UPI0024AD678A|nr:hypothetical protein [Anaerococcus sp. Marseille-Q7828]
MEARIFSGETTIIESNEFEWQKNISSGEYLDIESIAIGANNTISLRKKIPFYKYIINFLLLKYKDRLDIDGDIGEVSTHIFDSIEAKEKNEDLEKLDTLVIELFREKGLAPEDSKNEVYGSLDYKEEDRKIWKKTQIRKDLKANVISRDKMFIYAFGLGMSLEELEGFLMKVLEETGLNIWDNKEALIYIALKHFPDNPINFYMRADYLYQEEADKKISFEKKDTNLNTSILQNSLDDYLNDYKNITDTDDTLIHNIIAYHKDLVSENKNRTILTEFISTFNKIDESLSAEIAAFSNVKYGNDDGTTRNAEYFSMGKVDIFYKSDEDIVLKREDPFVFRSKETGEEKTYYPFTNYTLPANPEGGEKEITLRSTFYEDKYDVPILGTGEEYSDFAYVNTIPAITKIENDSIYISEKRLSSLLTYLYNEDALILREDSKLPDDQIQALDNLLKETKIRHENLNAIIEKGKISQITRSRLITLYFISYVLENSDIWFDKLSTPARRKRDYLIFMDYKLRNARLYEYNISNPYEETLLKLVVYDEPLEAFRDLWAKYLINIGDN